MEPDRDARREMREDGLSLTITSLAAVVTAWSAFQASTWSGVQMFALANAARLRDLSTQLRLEGDQQLHVDVDLFIAYAGALVDHRDAFAAFLRDRFPPRLRVATDAWLDTHPLESTSAPAHPLAMPEYRIEATERASAAQKASDDASDQAARANHAGDLYVLATVLLATIITVSSLGSRRIRRGSARTGARSSRIPPLRRFVRCSFRSWQNREPFWLVSRRRR
jgi:hypothetical protein